MLDSCVPAMQAGQGILSTTPPLRTPTTSLPHSLDSSTVLKPPAGAILESILGAAAVSVLVIISCVIVIRKMNASRTLRVRAGASRSSLTVSASSRQGHRQADIPLSTLPGTVRAAQDCKAGRPRGAEVRSGT
ncbi:hypothetical protein J7T55_002598 [Diaporthe amygdali]|uniref:uncharacterized protein n=1 Tax=Phomopsis amygdali TaxID=1214568 RepID=UPI0022FEB595|nr:uncharacterized protein J7T55_002598 [Diaporthe amygdali]KAJ0122086.1 hypothetical protein J7T55_002598 [Diaporthe amygdali]